MLKKLCVRKLAKKINEKGVSCEETLESVLDNLGCLAEEVSNFGESRYFIPLGLKEVLLSIIYENSRVHCELKHDDIFYEANAYVYKEDSDRPIGEGRFAYTINQYAIDQNISIEEAVNSFGNWVRGLAKTRAIQDALPFLNLYCEEDVISNEAGVPEKELPKPVTEAERKEKKRKEKAEKAQEVSANTQQKEPEDAQAAEMEKYPVEEKEIPKQAEEPAQAMTFEEACACIVDIGQLAGQNVTLGEVYQKQARNIIWMYNNGTSKHQEALKVIIDHDAKLTELLNKTR